jgi:muramidase (phage lysozyme)
VYLFQWYIYGDIQLSPEPVFTRKQPPLVMQGGDPYIRALMRTISASEANSNRPYSILYGGEQVHDLSRHPEKCVTIVTGPNTGNCSTAAGRYQIIASTLRGLMSGSYGSTGVEATDRFDAATQDKLYQDLHALALSRVAPTQPAQPMHNVDPAVLTSDPAPEVIAENYSKAPE